MSLTASPTLLPTSTVTAVSSPSSTRPIVLAIVIVALVLFVLGGVGLLWFRRSRETRPTSEKDLEANRSVDSEVGEKIAVDSAGPRHPAGVAARSAAPPRTNATSPAHTAPRREAEPASTRIPLFTRSSPPNSPPRAPRSSPRKPKSGRGQPIDYSLHTPDAANSVDPALRPFSLLAKVRHIDAGPGARHVLAKDLAERHWAYVMVRGPYVQTKDS